ncbi:hypothetical protein [Agromyces larvae]|uniref:Minor tail protein n=1 Tax=Agromyces larvae TaxID=2929802 RepID=A0ABY4C227_9MICO|nr:hypothetical protein [Agromyces larvae]UOE45465.1 hypothetical protein MTO99_06830 [Agromyces larvae]
MADVTGAPVPLGTDEFDIPGDLGALADHFGGQDMFSVANAAALPSSDSWPGRILMTRDTNTLYVRNGADSGWLLLQPPWTAYTPTLTNLNLGSGGSVANQCEWRREGDLIRVRFAFTLGSSGASVSGIPAFTLPVTAAALSTPAQLYNGVATLYDLSTTVTYVADIGAVISSVSQARVVARGGGSGAVQPVSGSQPFSWAAGDQLVGEFTYKPA